VRAILYDEPRTATIAIASPEAVMLVVGRDMFLKVISSRSQITDELMYRVSLQDSGIELRDLWHSGVIGCGTTGVVHLAKHRQSCFKDAPEKMGRVDGIPPLRGAIRD